MHPLLVKIYGLFNEGNFPDLYKVLNEVCDEKTFSFKTAAMSFNLEDLKKCVAASICEFPDCYVTLGEFKILPPCEQDNIVSQPQSEGKVENEKVGCGSQIEVSLVISGTRLATSLSSKLQGSNETTAYIMDTWFPGTPGMTFGQWLLSEAERRNPCPFASPEDLQLAKTVIEKNVKFGSPYKLQFITMVVFSITEDCRLNGIWMKESWATSIREVPLSELTSAATLASSTMNSSAGIDIQLVLCLTSYKTTATKTNSIQPTY
jgi:hypothetical protein